VIRAVALALGLAAVLPTAAAQASYTGTVADTYSVTGTGDSILAMAYGVQPGGVILDGARWLNFESGRRAYAPGQLGMGTTYAVAKLAIERAEPGGRIVIQDNGLDATQSQWESLLRYIVATTPADRWIIGVIPSFRTSVNPVHAATVRVRAEMMVAILRQHPRVRFVYMATIMQRFPWDFTDGQHPRTSGAQAAIRDAVAIGNP